MDVHANAAFYYIAEGYGTKGRLLMGRQSAGEGFLQGFARHAGVDEFFCYAPNKAQFERFQNDVEKDVGVDKKYTFIPFSEFRRLKEAGCLYFPGPNISNDAWVRRNIGNRAYSICGVTHTTATERVMDSFGSLLIDPVQSWDAVVCTSLVVKKTVERVIDEYANYIQERMGVKPTLSVQLPIIPLGVDCEQFSAVNKDEYRHAWREKLGIADDDIVVLYVGRLNFNAKAHPLPMFVALDEATRQTRKKVWLILAGWFDPPASETLWRQAAHTFCPLVRTAFLDGRQPAVRREIWSAADIFTSLSDNIQETFGLTPIEAMAAGLPVVVTDWDGYRDTVRHGIDGFRIPVLMPEPGLGEELAARFAAHADSYGKYCGTVSQMTSVDISACFVAYKLLIQDKELRKKMGDAGRQRAVSTYDWSKVVEQYQSLWQELSRRRNCDTENAPRKSGASAMPLRLDPFALFKEYPTGHITQDTLLVLQGGRVRGWLQRILSSRMNTYVLADCPLFLSRQEQDRILQYLYEQGKSSVADILQLFAPEKQPDVIRSIGWMAKNGVIGAYNATKRKLDK